MDKLKHYKFINSETGNVIYFLSVPEASSTSEIELEAARLKIASENGIFIGNIYYIPDESDTIE